MTICATVSLVRTSLSHPKHQPLRLQHPNPTRSPFSPGSPTPLPPSLICHHPPCAPLPLPSCPQNSPPASTHAQLTIAHRLPRPGTGRLLPRSTPPPPGRTSRSASGACLRSPWVGGMGVDMREKVWSAECPAADQAKEKGRTGLFGEAPRAIQGSRTASFPQATPHRSSPTLRPPARLRPAIGPRR